MPQEPKHVFARQTRSHGIYIIWDPDLTMCPQQGQQTHLPGYQGRLYYTVAQIGKNVCVQLQKAHRDSGTWVCAWVSH